MFFAFLETDGIYRLNSNGTADVTFDAKVGICITDTNGALVSSRVFSNIVKDIFVIHSATTGAYYNTEYDEDDNLTIYTSSNLISKNKMLEDNYYFKFRAK
ncbi:MAG: hypothetical protein B7Y39_18235 [Bdellovibrio sp. 28-41-41]|nr:MAG: hypothetical protein B7Y39_18235 [Bdellovibrio sp. 28-41-41]